MRYRYLEDLTYADVAYEAEGSTLEELFQNAADALMHVMVEDLNSILPRFTRSIHLLEDFRESDDGISNLLCEFLQKLIYWKDVDQLLLRIRSISITRDPKVSKVELSAEVEGEVIDSHRHLLGNDIKAVTYHQLRVWKENEAWKATVVVDT